MLHNGGVVVAAAAWSKSSQNKGEATGRLAMQQAEEACSLPNCSPPCTSRKQTVKC